MTTSQNTQTATTTRTRRPKRLLRVAAIGLAALVLATGMSTVANAAVTASEKSALVPYGEKVSLDAGDTNVYRNGGTGPTMVLLSGFGTPAPAVDFAPLIRELDAFDVIVVEGYGYGYSDTNVADRTIQNITEELHTVLERLDINGPVILVGHSVAGLYTRYYANTYPEDVAAVICIDPMTAKSSSLEIGTPSWMEGALESTGVFRAVTSIAPDLIQPPGDAYTADERERTAAMTKWNHGNMSISDEWSRIGANSTMAAEDPSAADLPVLDILASETVEYTPEWLGGHEAELAGVTTHRIETLEGTHYLHWTQAPAMARIMTEFLAASTTR